MMRQLAPAAALLFLNASVAFENVWPTPLVTWRGSLSVELAVLVLGITVYAARVGTPGRGALGVLTLLWLGLIVGRYAQVTAPALYGRDVNLYWDVRFIPDVVAMGARVAPWWLIVGCVAALVIAGGTLYFLVRWAIGALTACGREPRGRRVLLAEALAVLALFIAQRTTTGAPQVPTFAAAVTPTYARQVEFAVEALRGARSLPPSPAMTSNLSRVRGADVYVVFVEAYGAVAYDRQAFVQGLAHSRMELTSAIEATGRHVASALVASPTFGGSSWLAHLTLLSGVEVRDADTNARLMAQRRDTVVRLFARAGYRTIAAMPGLRETWPEGAFYGFDRIYGAQQLAYHGPEFGWFAVPDQFTLERIYTLEAARPERPPLFVFFPTISTHFPFSPRPPYQDDWPRLETASPYDPADLVRAYSEQPDWSDFAPGYVSALSYDFTTLAGYLRRTSDRDLVMIVLGDHQPAAAVSGQGARWDVPVHVIANRAPVIDALIAHGFRRGLVPSRLSLDSMAALLPILLDAFGDEPAK